MGPLDPVSDSYFLEALPEHFFDAITYFEASGPVPPGSGLVSPPPIATSLPSHPMTFPDLALSDMTLTAPFTAPEFATFLHTFDPLPPRPSVPRLKPALPTDLRRQAIQNTMAGGTMFEPSPHMHHHTHHDSEMMDWSQGMPMQGGLRREKDMAVPSPTYSHASGVESSTSPYSLPGSINVPQVYHQPHYAMNHLQVPQHRYPMHPHPATYYPSGGPDYDVFQAPSVGAPGRPISPAGDGFNYENPNGTAPLLTTSSLSRTYDSTIPQYYPVTTERQWSQTPDKEVGAKRKRQPKETPPSANAKALKTPKRAKAAGGAESTGRSNKRTKMEEQPRQVSQLPTPPSTGKEVSAASLPSHLRLPDAPPTPASEPEGDETPKRPSLIITRHHEEGRRLAIGAVSSGSEEPLSPVENKPERRTPVPVITTDATGHASLSTDMVLESELAWLENGGRSSPPSSPDMLMIQTPVLDAEMADSETTASPATKAERVAKQLAAFSLDSVKEEPMISTRIDQFGRVAVRKDCAIKFLGLSGTEAVEEVHHDDEELPIAGSSKSSVKPLWPTSAPWSLAGGSRKEKIQRDEQHKTDMIRRYLEATSDDSDEETQTSYAQSKGKGVDRMSRFPSDGGYRSRIVKPSRWNSAQTDARAALLTVMRHRPIPYFAPGVVACQCGAQTSNGLGAMTQCVNCKTWHHLVCNGIADETQIGHRWWCRACETNVAGLATPRSTPRNYIQSEERISAFKGELTNIALAPSPMFMAPSRNVPALTTIQTPMGRGVGSPSRPQRQRMLSYGDNLWSFNEDGLPGQTPLTPAPVHDRYSTPRIDDAPFDVTSTPSRHLDFNFGQPSLFSLTPLGVGRNRVPSTTMETPLTLRSKMGESSLSSRHDFLRDLGKGAEQGTPQSPRWPHGLSGNNANLSPSPFGHRRSLSGNKFSSMRSSSRSGLGLGLPLEEKECELVF